MTEDQVAKSDTNESPSMGDLLNDKNEPPQVGDIVEGIVTEKGKTEVHIDLGPLGIGVVRGRELYDIMDMQGEMKVGDKVSVTIIDLENEEGLVELSLKQAGQEKAWEEFKAMYKEGKTFDVKVADANKGGLIIFMSGVPAFMPVSQLTTEHYPRVEGGDKNEILRILKSYVRKKFRVKIIDMNQDEDKIILSEKAAVAEEKRGDIEKLKVGDIVEGEISGIVDFGAFMKFSDGIEGLIHISELDWKKINSPEDVVKIGEKVKAKIIGIDGTRISLSIKQLKNDPWKKEVKKYKVGQEVEGKITKINPFGAFVQLDDKIHGLAHVSELGGRLSPESKSPLKEGDTLKFKIISIEPEDHRLGLTLLGEELKSQNSKVKTDDDVEKKAAPQSRPGPRSGNPKEEAKTELEPEKKPEPELEEKKE